MSLADERVLELQSQTNLLERIQLLTRFGSNFISVSGHPGAGKTWIAQRYLEVWADDKNQSLLMCYPGQDEYQWRSTVLTQLYSLAEFNPDESLVSNLSAILEDEECNLVIVVDDANILTETLIAELWALVLAAQKSDRWTINVVLFSLPRSLDKVLSRLSDGEEAKPVDLEIETLTRDDADRFFEFLVIRYIDEKLENRVRRAYTKVARTPGEIMALGEQKMEKRIVIRSIVGSPAKIALIILLIALFVGGGYWWLLSENQAPDILHQATSDTTAQTVIPTLSGNQSSGEEKGQSGGIQGDSDLSGQNLSQAVQQKTSSQARQQQGRPMDDSGSLPPDVVEQAANVGVDDQGRRVVVSSEVVDALMEGKPDTSDTSKLHQVVSEVSPSARPRMVLNGDEMSELAQEQDSPADGSRQTSASPPSVADMPEPALQPSESTSEAGGTKIRVRVSPGGQSQESPSDDRFASARQALMNMSERSYTLQLAAFNSVAEVDDFIRQYRLQGQVNVYETVRNNDEWFMVTFKNYPTIQLARDAVATLPDPVQALGPWAKSIRQVHREIERAK